MNGRADLMWGVGSGETGEEGDGRACELDHPCIFGIRVPICRDQTSMPSFLSRLRGLMGTVGEAEMRKKGGEDWGGWPIRNSENRFIFFSGVVPPTTPFLLRR